MLSKNLFDAKFMPISTIDPLALEKVDKGNENEKCHTSFRCESICPLVRCFGCGACAGIFRISTVTKL